MSVHHNDFYWLIKEGQLAEQHMVISHELGLGCEL